MAKFALFFTYTGQTVKRLLDHPGDRASAVARTCESAGGRMIAFYLMHGPWDGMVIVEMPDSAAAAAISLAVSSTGSFGHVETHELIDADELQGILRQAATLSYAPPGT
jgi:uncharacterized protein with GYD domain